MWHLSVENHFLKLSVLTLHHPLIRILEVHKLVLADVARVAARARIVSKWADEQALRCLQVIRLLAIVHLNVVLGLNSVHVEMNTATTFDPAIIVPILTCDYHAFTILSFTIVN